MHSSRDLPGDQVWSHSTVIYCWPNLTSLVVPFEANGMMHDLTQYLLSLFNFDASQYLAFVWVGTKNVSAHHWEAVCIVILHCYIFIFSTLILICQVPSGTQLCILPIFPLIIQLDVGLESFPLGGSYHWGLAMEWFHNHQLSSVARDHLCQGLYNYPFNWFIIFRVAIDLLSLNTQHGKDSVRWLEMIHISPVAHMV